MNMAGEKTQSAQLTNVLRLSYFFIQAEQLCLHLHFQKDSFLKLRSLSLSVLFPLGVKEEWGVEGG